MDLIELEQRARAVLDPVVYNYVATGAGEDLTRDDNIAAWQRIKLRPHVLRDVRNVDTSTTVLGTKVRVPVLTAPSGTHGNKHPDAEAATAKGAAAAGTIMVCASFSTLTLEQVASAGAGAPQWFQVYAVKGGRAHLSDLVKRAAAAGYQAVVLTVDVAARGDRRHTPGGLSKELLAVGNYDRAGEPGTSFKATEEFDPGLTFKDIEWLGNLSELPIVIKGVLRADDALACLDAGASAIIVSNHGGRQLDTSIATADALGEIAEAVGGRAEILVDGGIRRGVDVVKALALGARAVLVGRPTVWAIAVGGAACLQDTINDFRLDLARAMALCGASRMEDLSPDLLRLPGQERSPAASKITRQA